MKKIKVSIVLLLVISMIFSGCGKDKEVDKKEKKDKTKKEKVEKEETEDDVQEAQATGGVLPSKICELGENAYIPDGSEASGKEESDIIPETLYGTWVKVSDATTDETLQLKASGEDVTVLSLPNVISFGNLDLTYVRAEHMVICDMGVSKAPSYAGLYWGCASNEVVGEEEKEDEEVPHFAPVSENEYASSSEGFGFCYDFSGDKLVLGYLDNNAGHFNMEMGVDVNVTERQYDVTWQGPYLTLIDGNESATYAPSEFIYSREHNQFNYSCSGMVAYGDAISDIYGLHMDGVVDDIGYLDSYGVFHEFLSLDITPDGKFKAMTEDGSLVEVDYQYSDTSFILIGDEVKEVILSEYESGRLVSDVSFSNTSGSLGWSATNIIIKDNEVEFKYKTLEEFIEQSGFEPDADLSQMVKAEYVTDEIIMSDGNYKFVIKAVNPWRDDLPLSECEICYIRIDDMSGMINIPMGGFWSEGQIKVGSTTMDEIISFCGAPYSDNGTELLFKGGHGASISPADRRPRALTRGNADLRVTISDDIVTQTEIEYPSYLYCGMQDNADPEALQQVGSNCFEMTVQVQNEILVSLEDEFNKAGIDISINGETGEITLNNSILFDVDSYELSDEGKAYIVSFMKVYTSVILSDDYDEYIDKIVIEGHTDSTGEFGHNLELSKNRANAVLEYTSTDALTGVDSITKQRFDEKAISIGRASTQLIIGDDGKEDRDASRRVTIKFWIDLSKTVE